MDVGYIRVSSVDQNTDRQLDGVLVQKTFEEKVSGATMDRPQLQAAMDFCREGDTLHVHSIDRLARSMANLIEIVSTLNAKGVGVRFHKENMLFTGESNPMQTLMFNMLGAFAQFEREVIKERQREGIAKAKAKGVYQGRPKSIDDGAILAALDSGLSFRAVAKQLEVSLSTVQRAAKSRAQ
ncbi:recombinase family protein [Pseudomonas putida]|uniref:recombinase family protein n=1 Tax=Pseudomonas putida TaxID=303 RepID=UPI0007716C15|nr:recombinase family protein [Pseudomonas putida]KWW13547.1 resolvase [Pseudomonas putida]MDQ2482851.1 recombinase family protein [Pseudomonas putida]